jgi:alpha-L-fucosidase 2
MRFFSITFLCCYLLIPATAVGQQSTLPFQYEKLDLESSPFQVSDSYLSKHDIVFQAPTDLEAEGFPMGNGNMGGMVWNHENGIEIQINKNDLWTAPMPHEYNRSLLKHAARLKIDFGAPVFSWIHLGDFTGRLSLAKGEASYKGTSAFADTKINTWIAQGKNVWVIECENRPNKAFTPDRLTTTVSLERIGSRAFTGWYSGHFPKDEKVGIGNANTEIKGRDLVLHETADGLDFVVACRIVDAESKPTLIGRHRGELKTQDPKLTVLVSVVTAKESTDPERDALSLLDEAEKQTIARLKQDKDIWYNKFWSNSFVKLGHDYLENIYYLRRYLMGAGSQGQYPVAFNGGLWRWNRDVINWGTPHHWNTQQQYWGLAAQNDIQLMVPYLNTYYKMIPDLEELAQEEGGGDDAILLTEAHEFDGRQLGKDWGSMAKSYTAASQVAQLFWDYYQFTGDTDFLRNRAYTFMKKASNFYLNKLQWDKEKKQYFLISSLYESETIKEAKNVLSDRATIEALFSACITAAKILKTDSKKVRQWQYVIDNLWPIGFEKDTRCGELPTAAETYFTADRYTPFNWAVGGAPAFPTGLIGIDDSGSRLGKAVINFAQCHGMVNAHYPTPVVAARMGLGDATLNYLVNGIIEHQNYPQGLLNNVTGYPDNIYDLKSIHDLIGGHKIRSKPFFQMGMEAMSEYATTVNEMLLQSNEGKIRVFPAIPSDWGKSSDIAFTLRARGAFIVSSSMGDQGEIQQVGIKSLQGNTCRLQNPWPGKKVVVYANNKSVKVNKLPGDVLSFSTKIDMEYTVRLADAPVGTVKTTFEGSPNQVPKKLGRRTLGKISGWNEDF